MVTLNIDDLQEVDKFRNLQLTLRDRWQTSELFDTMLTGKAIIGNNTVLRSGKICPKCCQFYHYAIQYCFQ